MENKNIYIYTLEDPTDSSQTIYVGYTINPEKRLKRHIEEATSNRPERSRYRNCWIRSLLNKGIMPNMIILEEVQDSDWQEAEMFYIAYFRSIGMKLCNDTDGGDGTLGHRHTDEAKEIMRQKKLGIPMQEEQKIKRMRQDLLESIGSIKELYLTGYSLTEIADEYNTDHDTIKLYLQRANVAIREEKHTERSREKIREANIGKTLDEETKLKIGATNSGFHHSNETRAQMSKTRKELLKRGIVSMPINKASGKDAGKYRDDVDDELLLKLYKDGLNLREIGRQVNLEHHSVKDRLIKLGIEFEYNAKRNTANFEFDLDNALHLHHAGKSCNAIGKELGCDGKVVKKYLEKAGVVFSKASNLHRNLDDSIARIKELYDKGFGFAEIGRIFDTSGSTIKSYLKKHGII